VKKKMTCEEFIRNNRGINGGVDLPHDFLRELYTSISQNEIRISADQQAAGAMLGSPVLWTDLAQQAQSPRARFMAAASMPQMLGSPVPPSLHVSFNLYKGPCPACHACAMDRPRAAGAERALALHGGCQCAPTARLPLQLSRTVICTRAASPLLFSW
jgi:hypothetical protein